MKIIHDNIRWLVAALLIFALPAVAEVRDTLEFDISGSTSESITVDGETFKLYTLPDCDLLDQTGAPMLPVKYIRLSVPYNATDITVTGAGPYTQSMTGDRIYPAPVPIPTDGSVTDAPDVVLDSAIYMTDAYWPACPVELVGDGFYMGENHIVTVAVYPMVYNPVTSQMRSHSQVRLTVSYTLGDTPGNMLVRLGGDLRQQEQLAVKAMVSNPMQVEQFAIPMEQAQHMPISGIIPDSLMTDSLSGTYGGELQPMWGDRARYLIVTTRELAPSFKRLAALKRQKGYSVQIKCIEDILADPRVQQGDQRCHSSTLFSYINDDAGKLRQYLKLAYRFDNTQFVLLGGKEVPFRSNVSIIRDKLGNEIGMDSIPTDWYYSDLTSMWGKSGNHTPEYYWYPSPDDHELLVGRLMADTKEQIDNYTDKLLRYELNPGHGNTSYLNRCLVVEGSELNPRLSTGAIMANAYSQITPDTTLVIQRGHDYPTGGDVISLINDNQYGILSIHGHGSPYTTSVNNWNYWYLDSHLDTVYSHESFQRICSLNGYTSDINNGLDCLTNKYFPGIYYSWSCDNAPFDNFQRSYYRSYDTNMAQSYTLGKDYGGVAFLGNTRSGFYSSADTEEALTNSPKIEKNFALCLEQGIAHLSEAEAKSKEFYHGSCCRRLLLTHNLHGDPELQLWAGAPSSLNNIVVVRNNNSISVAGCPQDSTIVAISSGENAICQKLSSNGQVIFNGADPNSALMVYRKGYLPYLAPLYLQNERIEHSQYVIANDVFAGNAVDPNRSTGDLTIAASVRYEIDAKGAVLLGPGFKVEKGALFSVTQSDY